MSKIFWYQKNLKIYSYKYYKNLQKFLIPITKKLLVIILLLLLLTN